MRLLAGTLPMAPSQSPCYPHARSLCGRVDQDRFNLQSAAPGLRTQHASGTRWKAHVHSGLARSSRRGRPDGVARRAGIAARTIGWCQHQWPSAATSQPVAQRFDASTTSESQGCHLDHFHPIPRLAQEASALSIGSVAAAAGAPSTDWPGPVSLSAPTASRQGIPDNCSPGTWQAPVHTTSTSALWRHAPARSG